jgi:hypothetical protein
MTPKVNITWGTSKLGDLYLILQGVLNVLDVVPVTSPFALIIQGILTATVSEIKSQSGKPIDLTQIPTETPIP